MKRQRNFGPYERTDQKSRKRAKRNGDKQFIKCRVQKTGYKDVQGTELTELRPQQHKKDPVRNEGYTN